MTGLPIDFQIQRQTRANALFSDHVRIPLMRIASPEWQPPTAARCEECAHDLTSGEHADWCRTALQPTTTRETEQ